MVFSQVFLNILICFRHLFYQLSGLKTVGKKVSLDFKFLLMIQVRKCHLFAYYLFSLLFTKMTKHETFIFQFFYYPFSLVAIYSSVYNTGQINYHHQYYKTLFRRQYYV